MEKESRLYVWKLFLLPEEPEEFSITCSFDQINQRVIRSDSERTRIKLMTKKEKFLIELLLTFYCKREHITYKQGLNEVLAPFLLFFRDGLSLCKVFLYFSNFIKNYLPLMFVDKEFKALETQFILYRLLLRYYDPELSSFLNYYKIGPELYATPWFLTLLASKISDIEVQYSLWESYMTENDKLYILFIAIAIIVKHRNLILQTDLSDLAQILSEITIHTQAELSEILARANELKRNLPYSLYISLYRSDYNNPKDIENQLIKIEKQFCLTILPREIIQRCYPLSSLCACSGGTCKWCQNSRNQVPLIILDCRTEVERENGLLPNTLILDPKAYNDVKTLLAVPDQYEDLKQVFHITLLGSKEFKHTDFDLRGDDSSDIDVVQNMIENLYLAFLKKSFPFVSVVEGGFLGCHQLISKLNLELDRHNPDYCLGCNPDGPKVSKVLKRRINSLRRSFIGKVKTALSAAGSAFRSLAPKTFDSTTISESTKEEPTKQNILPSNFIYKRELDEWKQDPRVSFFMCRKFDRSTNKMHLEECVMIVTRTRVIISTLFDDSSQNSSDTPVSDLVEQAKIRDLVKITSKRNSSSTLTFYFKNSEEFCFSYTFKDTTDAKACLAQVSSYFNLLRSQSLTSSL
ncbi:unnamed protein product [Blepharisma stoltei]|uniref:Rab-GAP TBC domain-containing protein n=1 Tax=Blepharisma stoltei TaxID=1481888 RepID=A0AAU9JHS4_9CILI|nr:unnamed protein product [Blepharisma stoltei]